MDAGFVIAAGLVFAGLAVSASLWWTQPSRLARRLLSRASEKPLREVGDGERVRVRGIALRAAGSLEAPFTGRPCLGFRMIVEEHFDGRWNEVLRKEQCLPFDLVADGVQAHVEGPFLVELAADARTDHEQPLSRHELKVLADLGVLARGSRATWRWLRFHESALQAHDPVWVCGLASVQTHPHGQRESSRDQPVRRGISGTKGEPTVLAPVDG